MKGMKWIILTLLFLRVSFVDAQSTDAFKLSLSIDTVISSEKFEFRKYISIEIQNGSEKTIFVPVDSFLKEVILDIKSDSGVSGNYVLASIKGKNLVETNHSLMPFFVYPEYTTEMKEKVTQEDSVYFHKNLLAKKIRQIGPGYYYEIPHGNSIRINLCALYLPEGYYMLRSGIDEKRFDFNARLNLNMNVLSTHSSRKWNINVLSTYSEILKKSILENISK
ncbi:MAG: hypothetical protein JST82_02085 [Bacteroidetes bacterium]|nr:hypothetical protein [Bacteroidota bacterium]